MSFQPYEYRNLHFLNTQYVTADGTNPKNIFTGVPTASRVDSVVLQNTDTIDHVVDIATGHASVTVGLCSVNVPAGAGTGTTPPVELFQALALNNVPCIYLNSAEVLRISLAVAMQAGKQLNVSASGGDF